ncbi:MAG: ABC transporter ATP-binding protein [Sphaerochaeta sp.]|nr:ABC transporter ATP-binding protein [Sphaerochaeta sp.]
MIESYCNILEIKDLCVCAGTKEVLNHIDLVIPNGEVHALLGQNGSGKTSLMMTIMGFPEYEVTHGQILFKGRDITESDVCERARLGIAIAQQRPPTIRGVTLRDILAYVLRNEDNPEKKIDELAQASRLESFLDRDINHGLSGGEIKRAELVQLLALSPIFSMMDEPDSGVDVEALSLMGALITQLFSLDVNHPVRRRAGLIITHTGNILNRFPIDKAHVMVHGRIGCSGNPSLLLGHINAYGYDSCIRCMGSSEKPHV